MGSDESCISNGCPQQLEVSLNLALSAAGPEEGIWELGGQGPISSEPNFDDLALSKLRRRPNSAHRACVWERAAETASMSPAMTPSSR